MKRRRLGQHYLVDPTVVEKMISTANVKEGEVVVEIGTGRGVLTAALSRLGSSFEGYEVDPENFRTTVDRVRGTPAKIHRTDAFHRLSPFDVLVSSLPYSRSATFVEWLSRMKYGRAVVLLQSDFVVKITSPPGDRDYRGISAIAQISADIKEIAAVGREAFEPRPKVDSMLVVFKPKTRLTGDGIAAVKHLFSLRRRVVESALAELGFTAKRTYGERRVYSLTPDEVCEICLEAPAE